MKGAVAWFARNHVAANIVMAMLLIGGLITLFSIKVETFPEFSMDRINVTVEYRGASPAEIEQSILKVIEEKISGLAGIRTIESSAREGLGTVSIEVQSGWDSKALLDEVKAEVDRITTFPEQAEKPLVRELTRRNIVISLAVYGQVSEATLKRLAQSIRDDLTALPGITLAEFFGLRNEEIHIEISEETLRRHGLTLGQVAEAVRRSSLDLPAGSVKTRGGEILVRTKGRRYHARDYRDIAVITRPDGTRLTLGQIAQLKDGFEDSDLAARFQGKPAALINVFRVGDQNALEVAAAVKKYLDQRRPNLPAGVDIEYYRDMSKILKSRIDLLSRNMIMGLILVAVLLGLVLNLRLAFWVTLGIPISFLAAIWALPSLDVSINMVSLFAFLLVLGIVVDDAIVVGENIYSKVEQGLPKAEAAVVGAQEMAQPVVFSVLTTVVAFVPLLFGGGMIGKMLYALPVVVSMVLLASLFESFFILPSHLATSKLPGPGQAHKEKAFGRWLKKLIRGPYRRFLDLCLNWRYATLATGLVMLLICFGILAGGHIKFVLFPHVDSDVLVATLTMPAGTSAQTTTNQVVRLSRAAQQVLKEADKRRPPGSPPLFQHAVAIVGVQLSGMGPRATQGGVGSNLGQIYVQVLEGEKRKISSSRLVNLWRKRVGAIPEAKSLTFQSALFQAGNAIEVHLSHRNYEPLLQAAAKLKAELARIPGVTDIGDSFLPGKKEVQLKLKPAARPLGLTLQDLALQVRHAFYGAEALRLQREQDEVRVLVRYPEAQRRSLASLEEMRVRTPSGDEVPFSQVAAVHMDRGYATIERVDRRRVVKVFADVDTKRANANEIRQSLAKSFLPQLARSYPGLRISQEGEQREQRDAWSGVLQAFAVALFGIYALLAIPFRSFSQPLIVMVAIPFGLVGALLGHIIMGFNFSMLSVFGAVGLTGVVVNDSLVLVHAANELRRSGNLAPGEAIRQAGERRFRPILLTSLTTFAGLTPIIFERSLQAQFLIPMAVSLGFGVLFATFITLLLIPCGYLMLDDIHNIWFRLKARHGSQPAPAAAGQEGS